jgi:predicted DNA-binding transcriptional regulator AlpA
MPTKLVFITWRQLKDLGHPYCRAHTYRLMARDVDPFPQPIKLGTSHGHRVIWELVQVKAWYESKGATLQFPD